MAEFGIVMAVVSIIALFIIYISRATAVDRGEPAAVERMRAIERGQEAYERDLRAEAKEAKRAARMEKSAATQQGWHIRDMGTVFDVLSPKHHTYVVGKHYATQGIWVLECDNCRGWRCQKSMGRITAHNIALKHAQRCWSGSAEAQAA